MTGMCSVSQQCERRGGAHATSIDIWHNAPEGAALAKFQATLISVNQARSWHGSHDPQLIIYRDGLRVSYLCENGTGAGDAANSHPLLMKVEWECSGIQIIFDHLGIQYGTIRKRRSGPPRPSKIKNEIEAKRAHIELAGRQWLYWYRGLDNGRF